jgi:hypothetical protein
VVDAARHVIRLESGSLRYTAGEAFDLCLSCATRLLDGIRDAPPPAARTRTSD